MRIPRATTSHSAFRLQPEPEPCLCLASPPCGAKRPGRTRECGVDQRSGEQDAEKGWGSD